MSVPENAPPLNEEALFHLAAGLPVAERAGYLQAACAGQPAVRARLERLLASHEDAAFMRRVADRVTLPEVPVPDASRTREGAGVVRSAHELPAAGGLGLKPVDPLGRRIGDYELLEEIARGGMGVVFKARQRNLDRIVALKMILAGEFASREQALRFRAEAEATARLRHPNIVRIHETGEQDGQPYFSMDYVEGGNLAMLVREKPLPAKRAADYVKRIAEAIHYAHEQGILHRDLKPSNVLIDQANQPQITDFGLAKRMQRESFLTVTGDVMGSPNFMPPEQAGGKGVKAGRYSDVYSLGGILFFLVTGRAPFVAGTVAETMHHVLNTEPVSPRLLNPSVPEDIATICLKCLEKDPERRFQTAQQFADELGRFLNEEPIHARPASRLARVWRWCRRKPALAVALTAAHLFLLGLLIGGPVLTYRINQERKHAEAERHHAEEVSIQLQLQRAEDLFSADNPSSGLAYLVRVLRKDPGYRPAAERLLSALTWRSFGLPVIPPFQHAEQILCARFSPDGLRVATSSADKTARIWDAHSGQLQLPTLQHQDSVCRIEFSPNSELVVTAAADGTARVWDARTGQAVTPPLSHDKLINMARFSPDGRWVVTASRDQKACLWDARTGQPIAKPLVHEAGVNSAVFSPDGARVVTASDDHYARVWNTSSGQLLVQTPVLHSPVKYAEFSRDGQRFVTAAGSTVCLWDSQTGRRLATTNHHDEVVSVQFSSDGDRLITASLDRTCRICDARSLVNLIPPLINNGPVRMAAFSADGLAVVTCSEDSTARVWDARTGQPLSNPLKHLGWVLSANFSPDGRRILVQSSENVARVWEVSPGQARGLPLAHNAPVVSARFSPDGQQVVTACEDGTARLWDAGARSLLLNPLWHQRPVVSAEFSPDGRRIAIASSNKTARQWDARTGQPIGPPLSHEQKVWWAEYSPDGELLVTCSSDQTARVWSARTSEALTEPLKHEQIVVQAEFSPDSSLLATTSADGFARVWEARTGRLTAKLWQGAGFNAVHFSPDGQSLVTACSANFALLWDLRTRQQLTPPLKHDNWVHSARFSADGKRVVTASADHSARVWDARTGQPLTEPLRHGDVVLSARFSADGNRIVTASKDGSARVWDASTGLPVTEPLRHDNGVTDACFSPDGQSVLTASQDHTARLWPTPTMPLPVPGWLLDLADAVAGQRFNGRDLIESLSETNLLRIQRQLVVESRTDFYLSWGTWFFADRRLRRVSPFSKLTIPEYVTHRVQDNQLAGLREAVELAPTDALALARLAQRVMQSPSGDYARNCQEADWLTQRAMTLQPTEPRIALARADYLHRTGHVLEAIALLKQASLRQPRELDFWLIYGIVLRSGGLPDEACAMFSRAIDLAVGTDESTEFHRKHALLQRSEVWKELHRDDEAVADFCRARKVPERDPRALAGQLDLTRFFNVGLADGWGAGNELASLPTGLQAFAGVEFDVRGVVQLCGAANVPAAREYPSKVAGIPVGRRCQRIHFLHAAGFNAPEGSRIGAYVLRFVGGETREFPLLHAQNIHCCLWSPWRARELGTNCVPAWHGSNADSEGMNAELNLYRTTWENPLPEKEVTTIDFVSGLGSATPFLVAITVD